MGDYTELVFQGQLKDNKHIPNKVFDYIQYFFGHDCSEPCHQLDHPLFNLPRWRQIGHCASYYHWPLVIRKLEWDSISQSWFMFLRCDIKDYDKEIENFIDWISPYCESFKAWKHFEYDCEPKLYGFESWGS